MESKIVRSTLVELGRNLPFGIEAGGKRDRSFSFKEWHYRDETFVDEARMRCAKADLNDARFASELLAHFVTKWGPFDFGPLTQEERIVRLEASKVGDILTAWIWLRIDALGPEMPIRVICPACGSGIERVGDLHVVDVMYLPPDCSSKEASIVVNLPNGVPWVHKQKGPFMARKVLLEPAAWMGLASIRGGAGIEERIGAGLAASIRALDDEPVSLTGQALASLPKRDLMILTHALAERAIGPILEIHAECGAVQGKNPDGSPKTCPQVVRQLLTWSHNPFFMELPSSVISQAFETVAVNS